MYNLIKDILALTGLMTVMIIVFHLAGRIDIRSVETTQHTIAYINGPFWYGKCVVPNDVWLDTKCYNRHEMIRLGGTR